MHTNVLGEHSSPSFFSRYGIALMSVTPGVVVTISVCHFESPFNLALSNLVVITALTATALSAVVSVIASHQQPGMFVLGSYNVGRLIPIKFSMAGGIEVVVRLPFNLPSHNEA